MRKPSPQTELRTLKRELREVVDLKARYQREAMDLREQLDKSRADAAEWRERFDTLLRKAKSFEVPTSPELNGAP